MNKKITSVKHLKRLSHERRLECAIVLSYGLLSVKQIRWNSGRNRFSILNCIDGSRQYLTEKEITCKEETNIGEAIRKGAFIIRSNRRSKQYT